MNKKICIYVALLCFMWFRSGIFVNAAGTYTEPGSNRLTNNWANPVKCHTFISDGGASMIVYSVLRGKEQTLMIDIVSEKGICKNYKRLPVPGETWGGTVYRAPDGCYYIITGNDGDNAYYILKYDSSWNLLATTVITRKESYTAKAFEGGNSDMALTGNYLIVHAARGRGDGHQSNIGFCIDTRNMEPVYIQDAFAPEHVSHSFNQFVRCDGNRVITIDQGDGYPRGICMINREISALSGKYVDGDALMLMPFWGSIGANYTGVTVDGFELGSRHHLVVGTSIPHDTFTSMEEYQNYEGGKNIYIILIDKDLKSSNFKWLTSNITNVDIKNLKLMKVNDDEFVLLYGIEQDGKDTETHYMMIDSDGNVKKSGSIQKPFYCTSEPSFNEDILTWCHYVESELGNFLVMSQWNIQEGKFDVYNIDTGLASNISKVMRKPLVFSTDKEEFAVDEEFSLTINVYSNVFQDKFPTAPAVWTSSDADVIKVLQEETILGTGVINRSYKTATASFQAKKEGTAIITCSVGDKKCIMKLKVNGKEDKNQTVRTPNKIKKISIKKKKKTTVTVSWKKLSGADSYQIQYADNKKFRKKKTRETKKNTIVIKGLKKKKTYYFRIRACRVNQGKKLYGKWSSVKRYKNGR